MFLLFSNHLVSSFFPSDLVDYDSEIYANGALETGANHRYQQILQQQQQQQRSPLENRQLYANNRDFRQIQQVRL